MPNSLVKSLAKKSGKSASEVEDLWDRAVELAKKQGISSNANNFFAYVVGILKKMLKVESAVLLNSSPDSLFEVYTDGTPHRIRQTPINNTSKIFKRDSFLKRRDDRDKNKKPEKNKKKNKRPAFNDIPGIRK